MDNMTVALSADTTNAGSVADVTLEVANLLGTEYLNLYFSGSQPQAPGVNPVSVDFSSPTVVDQVGTDLAYSYPTGVTSTAGGIFVVRMWAQGYFA